LDKLKVSSSHQLNSDVRYANNGQKFNFRQALSILSPYQKGNFYFGRKVFVSHQVSKGKGNIVPLQAWIGPEGSRKLRFPDYMAVTQDGGKVVSLSHRPPCTLQWSQACWKWFDGN